MKRTIQVCIVAAAIAGLSAYQDSAAQTGRELLAAERASMDGWLKGDSAPMLAASDPDITLFHAVAANRVDGIAAVQDLYAPFAGRPLFDSYKIENPKVQAGGDMAVLSYQLVVRNGDAGRTWNATEVYQRKKAGWRVIHSHFSVSGALQP